MRFLALIGAAMIGGQLISLSTASAVTYVVNPDGTGDFPTIVAAVDQADTGDIIELTDGTFTGDGNRDIGYGGKAITVRSQSGDPEACIIDCGGSETEPHRGFLFEGEGLGPRLEGVTITNGYSFGGSAIFCSLQASVTVVNCILRGNTADSGAGLYCQDDAVPDLINCVFRDNVAFNGAGMSLSRTTATLTGCSFISNTASNAGGAVDCGSSSSITLTDCIFSDNSSVFGGGGFRCTDQSFATLIRCTFSDNSSDSSGGALYCGSSASVAVTNCTFTGNSGGAGIYCGGTGSLLTIENSIIAYGLGGQAILLLGGGIANLSCCDIFDNEGGDWVGDIAGQLGVNGNVSVDPEFCSTTPGDDMNWALQSDSPCAADNNPGCGQVGAWPVGCGASVIEPATWGRIKAVAPPRQGATR